ncbi:ras-related protein Rab-3-like [Montipora capricornis]|uniref:ras-related protein Rab-3-like n=1 Tax=Montipora capricornis TaxID=246305 RepID=UPI0035F13899
MAKAEDNFDHIFKILIIGNSGVGKTSCLLRFTNDSFKSGVLPTTGIDFRSKVAVWNGKQVHLQIWDTAGQERYKTITTAYYRGAAGFIIMYDIRNESSFQAVQDWLTQVETHSGPDAEIVLVGNMNDMEKDREVASERGKQLAEKFGIEFLETSAKHNINVERVFERLVDIILTKMAESSETVDGPEPATVKLSDNPVQIDWCYC